MPRGKEKIYYQTAMNLAVGANTQLPEAAWNFLLFIVSEKGQQVITLSRSDIPVLKKLAYSQEFLSYQDRPDANEMFREMIENSVPAHFCREWKSGRSPAATNSFWLNLSKFPLKRPVPG